MEKARLTIGKSLVIFLLGVMAIIAFYILFSENSILDIINNSVSKYILLCFVILIFIKCINYSIVFSKDGIVFKKLIFKNVDINYDCIQKITFESYRHGGLWNWDKIYIYYNSRIYEYSVSLYPVHQLLHITRKVCELKGIELDESKLKI